jgi:hypothetical protein
VTTSTIDVCPKQAIEVLRFRCEIQEVTPQGNIGEGNTSEWNRFLSCSQGNIGGVIHKNNRWSAANMRLITSIVVVCPRQAIEALRFKYEIYEVTPRGNTREEIAKVVRKEKRSE